MSVNIVLWFQKDGMIEMKILVDMVVELNFQMDVRVE